MGSDDAGLLTNSAAPDGIFGLPDSLRYAIFRRVLIVPDELQIFQDPGGPVEAFAPDRPRQWQALLLTNSQIGREAAAILYGQNRFNFLDITSQQVALLEAFLRCIGPLNGHLVSHACVNFPIIEMQPDGKHELRSDGSRTLQLLKENCRGLRTLELHVHRQNSNQMTEDPTRARNSASTGQGEGEPINGVTLADQALKSFDVRLNAALPSLETVIVRFHTGRPTPSAMRILQGSNGKFGQRTGKSGRVRGILHMCRRMRSDGLQMRRKLRVPRTAESSTQRGENVFEATSSLSWAEFSSEGRRHE